MSSKSTATPENALTREEIDERLASHALARLATYRADGMIHLTPMPHAGSARHVRETPSLEPQPFLPAFKSIKPRNGKSRMALHSSCSGS